MSSSILISVAASLAMQSGYSVPNGFEAQGSGYYAPPAANMTAPQSGNPYAVPYSNAAPQPYPSGPTPIPSNEPLPQGMGMSQGLGTPGPSEAPGYPALQNAYQFNGFEGQSEQRYPFDTQQNWVHGYFQEIPAYGGHHVFRPYNYKDVLSQAQTAGGWGLSPTMPYSQQFWHRYQDRAAMLKLSQNRAPLPEHQVQQFSPVGYPSQASPAEWPQTTVPANWNQPVPPSAGPVLMVP